ncbi:MAG: hypothetical protein H7Z12_07385 [Rhodospirillaceae bacterium]|nr:hypothetical protein [Rhodospirillales bacterium]
MEVAPPNLDRDRKQLDLGQVMQIDAAIENALQRLLDRPLGLPRVLGGFDQFVGEPPVFGVFWRCGWRVWQWFWLAEVACSVRDNRANQTLVAGTRQAVTAIILRPIPQTR